jgi:hypothetical protein
MKAFKEQIEVVKSAPVGSQWKAIRDDRIVTYRWFQHKWLRGIRDVAPFEW